MKNLNVDRDILFFAFRYALGRSSYAPTSVMDNIKHNLVNLSESEIEAYVKEIEECEFFGMDLDKASWLAFKNVLEEALFTRRNPKKNIAAQGIMANNLKPVEEYIDMIQQLKEIATKHSLINHSTFSYFPELNSIRPLLSLCGFHLVENYRIKHGIPEQEDVEFFVEHEGFKFSFGENYAPYDPVYIYTKTDDQQNYISFLDFFNEYK